MGVDPKECARRVGGTVLRLAGLYNADIGPHAYWWKTGKVSGAPNGLLNLVHYDDAASAVVAALNKGRRHQRTC